MKQLRGTTTRQDEEVRQLRTANQDLSQKAALVAVLTAEAAALKAQVSAAVCRDYQKGDSKEASDTPVLHMRLHLHAPAASPLILEGFWLRCRLALQ